mmetsp:Transcript_11205/g.25659  ORF Transcript_11205/g.25659 Transcript_11205/m.25659 type:complete len:149 (+) Transcript_11205:3-449(+)
MVGAPGESCAFACEIRGRSCSEARWPASEGQLEGIASALGVSCDVMQKGHSNYDPSATEVGLERGGVGYSCGWLSENESSGCQGEPSNPSRRFCWCEDAPEQTSTTTVTFDCQAGADNVAEGWSEQKKEWCCAVHSAGCPESSQALVQ